MSSNNIPTPGTRFTYTRFTESYFIGDRTNFHERWSGVVVRSFLDEFEIPAVETVRDDNGETETFWNDSWNLLGFFETVEVHT